MTIHSLRSRPRPDNLRNQPRSSQSFARKLYLGILIIGGTWGSYQVAGPLIFLDADGLVLQDRKVIGAQYTAQVLSLTVRPGDHVAAGDRIGSVVSSQMLDLISELTTKEAQAASRVEQIEARLIAIALTMTHAQERSYRAEMAFDAVNKLAERKYTTITRLAEISHERYESERESNGLHAERTALISERQSLQGTIYRLSTALHSARATYRDGVINSPVDGTIGPKVASSGTVLRPGEAIADVYHGAQYVIAYLPTNRFYSVRAGKPVVVSDGGSRHTGHIERVEALTDALPSEFQSNFRSTERRQVARVTLDQAHPFPLLAKIDVSDVYAISNLAAEARSLATGE